MNQAELQRLAEERIQDAEALLDGSRWEFAYYAAGYAVECALKSCVLSRMVLTGWVFKEEVKRVDECRIHDYGKLISIAGLLEELNERTKQSGKSGDRFQMNWDMVRGWQVTSRYETKSEIEARSLLQAIIETPDGILPWIRNYW